MGSSELFTEFVGWAAEGFLTYDPIRSAIGTVVYLVLGLWSLLTGAPIVI